MNFERETAMGTSAAATSRAIERDMHAVAQETYTLSSVP